MTGWKDTRPSAQDPETRFESPPDPLILQQLHDAHCHPGDDDNFDPQTFQSVTTGKFCVMSSSLSNQQSTKQVYQARPNDVIPCFGLHPWFSHSISFSPPSSLPSREAHYTSLFPTSDSPDSLSLSYLLPHLPPVTSIETFLSELERDLLEYPTSLVGEIGLDKAFKLPHPPSLISSHPDPLPKNSQFSTPIDHQARIVQVQIDLAIKLKKNVSLHSVRSTSDTVELLKTFKTDKVGFQEIYVCLHSFGGSAEAAKQIQKNHPNVFFSFSTIISGRSPNFYKLLQSIEPERLLLESDFSKIEQIDSQIWEIFEAVCKSRDWTVEETLTLLKKNWERFTQSSEERTRSLLMTTSKKSSKQRKREKHNEDLYVSDEDADEGKGMNSTRELGSK
ncbi:hypothetical protein JCM3765_006516 [Sporobolomyces pararoseus]